MSVNPDVSVKARVAAHDSSDSRPRILAAPAFAIRVRLLEPRNWNWKLSQFSWNTAPFQRNAPANVIFQPSSTFVRKSAWYGGRVPTRLMPPGRKPLDQVAYTSFV